MTRALTTPEPPAPQPSCRSPRPRAQDAGAQVRVLHGIPGTPVDVYVDGER